MCKQNENGKNIYNNNRYQLKITEEKNQLKKSCQNMYKMYIIYKYILLEIWCI